jgi:cytochrome c peroxidase
MIKISNILCFIWIFAVYSCKVDPSIEAPYKLSEVVPAGWPKPVYSFSIATASNKQANTLTEEKFQLGRALFYEPMLSKDNTISCETCHQLTSAFANTDHRVSHGIRDLEGERNSPALFNLNWHPYFMHDGGINHIEVQPLGPISNPIEMDETINNVLAKLRLTTKYKTLFKNAFGSEEISSERFLLAFAQFLGTLYSYNSKFDRYKRNERNVTLKEDELRGYTLFKQQCNSCHTEPLFTDFKFRNNGLLVDAVYQDSGRAHITRLETDMYKFKTPSLRNVEKTEPYMHDGRYSTLEECLNHYTSKIENFKNLDPLLTNKLPLNDKDKTDIIAFLRTLTDYTFLTEERFGPPKTN